MSKPTFITLLQCISKDFATFNTSILSVKIVFPWPLKWLTSRSFRGRCPLDTHQGLCPGLPPGPLSRPPDPTPLNALRATLYLDSNLGCLDFRYPNFGRYAYAHISVKIIPQLASSKRIYCGHGERKESSAKAPGQLGIANAFKRVKVKTWSKNYYRHVECREVLVKFVCESHQPF